MLERDLDSNISVILVRDMNKKGRDEEHEHLDPSIKNLNSFFLHDVLYTTYDIRTMSGLLDSYYRFIQSSQRKISSSQFFFYRFNHYSLMAGENQFIVEIEASVSIRILIEY